MFCFPFLVPETWLHYDVTIQTVPGFLPPKTLLELLYALLFLELLLHFLHLYVSLDKRFSEMEEKKWQ